MLMGRGISIVKDGGYDVESLDCSASYVFATVEALTKEGVGRVEGPIVDNSMRFTKWTHIRCLETFVLWIAQPLTCEYTFVHCPP